ncbi:MAG: nuclear transport factor 2 family protein [Chloroflexota bacterium]|nr:nuclear transport factor 2 family protein [Chloroflexota bacterium]
MLTVCEATETEALVRRLLQAMNQHGAAAFAALISTDFVNHDPFSPPVPGPGNSGRHCAV